MKFENVFLLICVYPFVLLMYFLLKNEATPQKGLYYGVTLNKEQAKELEVGQITKIYNKQMRRYLCFFYSLCKSQYEVKAVKSRKGLEAEHRAACRNKERRKCAEGKIYLVCSPLHYQRRHFCVGNCKSLWRTAGGAWHYRRQRWTCNPVFLYGSGVDG